jgi:hypothetical protein
MNRRFTLFGIWAAGLRGACGPTDTGAAYELELLEPAVLAAAEQTADPSLAIDPETGDLLVAWGAETDGTWNLYFARSADGGSSFSETARVNDVSGDLYPHAEGAPRLVAAPGVAALFWNNRIDVDGRFYSASDMRFARSTDGGETWSAATTLQDPIDIPGLPPRGNSFHGAGWAGDSTLVVAWIDGRERDRQRIERGIAAGLTVEEAARTPEEFSDADEPRDGDGALYAAVSHDLGATWEPTNTRIQDRICPCCRVSLERTPEGALLGSWRMHFDGSIRDPVIQTVFGPHGDAAEDDLVRIHRDDWVYPGCPHSGPALDVDEHGTVHAAWYTAGPGRVGVHYARKDRDAAGFAAPVPVVADEGIPLAHPAVVALPDGRAVVATNVDADGRRVIVLTGVSETGGIEFQMEVPDSDRGTHPQLARLPDGRVVAAWTESREGVQRVRLARLTPAGLPEDRVTSPQSASLSGATSDSSTQTVVKSGRHFPPTSR